MSVVLITGCSSGFGLETAIAFARGGDTVYATMRNLEKSDPLQRRAGVEGLELQLIALDVTDARSVVECVDQIEARHGSVDVLVNNAGIASLGSVEVVDLDVANGVFETNLWGAIRTIQAVLPAMRANRSGVIINVSSVAARLPGVAHTSWYGASKHALSVVSEGLANELHGTGVRVVCIEPGFFRTEIGMVAGGSAPEDDFYAADRAWVQAYYTNGVAGGGDPADVAAAIVAAASDPATPLHVLVPDEMKELVAVAGAVEFEQWLPGEIASFEAAAGPRPPR